MVNSFLDIKKEGIIISKLFIDSMADVTWFKNAIIYHILIDRFAGFTSTENWDKPVFLGGTIKGIIDKLPYLIDLGVDTLWISPFYETTEYHGYHITNFYKVDPRFGTIRDIEKLIRLVHKHNMHIITDFVPNHCSKEHPFFKEAQHDKNSMYRNWFYFTRWPDRYLCFLSIKELPKINLDYIPAREYMLNVARFWVKLGFDGFRLDHVIGPSKDFWLQFKKEIKKLNPGFVLIGEAWMEGIKFNELKTINVKGKIVKWFLGASSEKLLRDYVDVFDGVLDFRLQEILRDYIARNTCPEALLFKEIKRHYDYFPEGYFLPTFLDNHDMDRFLFECGNDKEKLKEAAKVQFMMDQPPIIYYGTEVGMTQSKSIWSFPTYGDLQARQPMKWQGQDVELLSFYKELINKRKKNKTS